MALPAADYLMMSSLRPVSQCVTAAACLMVLPINELSHGVTTVGYLMVSLLLPVS